MAASGAAAAAEDAMHAIKLLVRDDCITTDEQQALANVVAAGDAKIAKLLVQLVGLYQRKEEPADVIIAQVKALLQAAAATKPAPTAAVASSAPITPSELISIYQLEKHPEGGYYKRFFTAETTVTTPRGVRPTGTSIHFLLKRGEVSNLHRLQSFELWNFYLGGPLTVVELDDTEPSHVRTTVLGTDVRAGQRFQYVVKPNVWFGAILHPDAEFAFVGCSVTPGFSFEDFELAKREPLLALYPSAAEYINKMTSN